MKLMLFWSIRIGFSLLLLQPALSAYVGRRANASLSGAGEHHVESRALGRPWKPVGPPGPARTLTIVSDWLEDPKVPEWKALWVPNAMLSAGERLAPASGYWVRPTHTWLIFGPALDENGRTIDGPLRVELVSPLVDENWEGLAVSVTDYTVTRDDEGQLDWPLPANTRRRTHTFKYKTVLTNDQLFNINYGTDVAEEDRTAAGGADPTPPPPGLIQHWWFRYAHRPIMTVDEESIVSNSQLLVQNLLENTDLRLITTPDMIGSEIDSFLFLGKTWARLERSAALGDDDLTTYFTNLNHLFYEARRPNTVQGQRPNHIQMLYEIEPPKPPTQRNYVARRLKQGWAGFLPALDNPLLGALPTTSDNSAGSAAPSPAGSKRPAPESSSTTDPAAKRPKENIHPNLPSSEAPTTTAKQKQPLLRLSRNPLLTLDTPALEDSNSDNAIARLAAESSSDNTFGDEN